VSKPARHRNKWRIRWKDHAGKRQSEVYPRYRDAELALRRHEVEASEIRAGLRSAPAEPHSFSDLAAYWRKHRASRKRSRRDDESMLKVHLEPAFGDLPLGNLTVARVDVFVGQLTVSTKTQHNILTLLISMLNVAVDLHWIRERPRIKKPRLSSVGHDFRYLRTREEIGRFLRAAVEHSEDTHALYATATYTGMRAGELAGLRWADVDLDLRIITVQRSYGGPTKAGRVRYVPIVDALLPTLRTWRLKCPNEHVFPNKSGSMHQPSARVFQETLHRVLRSAGLPERIENGRTRYHITFHGMRHTFASHWMMNGGDIFKLQRIGGWESFAMVQRYAHLAPEAFAADYARLGPARQSEDGKVVDIGSARPA
jgi:integrase